MIKTRVKELMAEKERITGERITYDRIWEATGIWPRTLSTLATNQQKMLALKTLDLLCAYFDCQPGDILVYTEEEQ